MSNPAFRRLTSQGLQMQWGNRNSITKIEANQILSPQSPSELIQSHVLGLLQRPSKLKSRVSQRQDPMISRMHFESCPNVDAHICHPSIQGYFFFSTNIYNLLPDANLVFPDDGKLGFYGPTNIGRKMGHTTTRILTKQVRKHDFIDFLDSIRTRCSERLFKGSLCLQTYNTKLHQKKAC